jgi:hypothetical protein
MRRNKRLFVVTLALAFTFATISPSALARGRQKTDQQPSEQFPQGALSPANLAKPRPKPPFNLTGLWMVDLSAGFSSFMFGPPYPKFKPAAQAAYEEAQQAAKEHKSFRDDIGQCYPAGMPMIMTRVWPIAMIQLPTAIYMISGFENEIRIIYLDGRPHTPADIVVPSYDGDSIGHWEGDTLVVDTTSMISAHHWIDSGLPLSDEFHIIERMRLTNGGKTLEIKYIMTDPKNWDGVWTSTKKWQREDDQDITEVECTPDLNKHLLSTQDELK